MELLNTLLYIGFLKAALTHILTKSCDQKWDVIKVKMSLNPRFTNADTDTIKTERKSEAGSKGDRKIWLKSRQGSVKPKSIHLSFISVEATKGPFCSEFVFAPSGFYIQNL